MRNNQVLLFRQENQYIATCCSDILYWAASWCILRAFGVWQLPQRCSSRIDRAFYTPGFICIYRGIFS